MNETVSIVILCCNKAEYTSRCMAGVLRSTHDRVQLILVDNGSTDSTPEVLDAKAGEAESRGWAVERIRFDENLGAIAGRNAAFEKVTGDLVALLDNDVHPRRMSWMETLGSRLLAEPDLGIVGPKMIYPFIASGAEDHMIQCAGCDVSPTGKVDFRGRGAPRTDPQFNEARDVQCLISACWIMKREVLDTVGPLDDAFSPVQFEDVDYCYRARYTDGRDGPEWRVAYEPAAEMYHFENVTSGRTSTLNYRYLTVKNGLKFKRKWQHRFASEGGKPESEMKWRFDIPQVRLEDVADLAIDD